MWSIKFCIYFLFKLLIEIFTIFGKRYDTKPTHLVMSSIHFVNISSLISPVKIHNSSNKNGCSMCLNRISVVLTSAIASMIVYIEWNHIATSVRHLQIITRFKWNFEKRVWHQKINCKMIIKAARIGPMRKKLW